VMGAIVTSTPFQELAETASQFSNVGGGAAGKSGGGR